MELRIDPDGTWYHGSNRVFSGTVMDKNAEFLTKRPLKVKLIYELQDEYSKAVPDNAVTDHGY